jgi:rod shape-determining protein MreC
MILLALTGLALAMLCVPESQTHALRGQALSAFAPVFGAFASARPSTASTRHSAENDASAAARDAQLAALEEERDKLKHENVLLREQLRQFNALQQAMPTASGLAAKGLPARVIARDGFGQEPMLGIDQGAEHGVRQGTGVLYRGAALGRVVSAGPRASCVALLTHRGVTVAARLADCRAEGVLSGMKEAAGADGERLCRMRIVTHDLQAREGENVVTSGLDGSFPAGCLLGTIVRIERAGDMDWTVIVRPACASPDLEAVFVLTLPPADVPWPKAKGK